MTAASKLSLKPCRKTQQGFHARKSIAAKRGEVSPLGKTFPTSAARFPRLGKCSCAARQGFPAWKNVPRKPSKVFPLGKVFPTSAARFSHYSHPENFHRLACSPVWRAYAIRPYMLFSMTTIKSGALEPKFRCSVYPT